MRTQVYVTWWRVNENEWLTTWFRQKCRVLENIQSGMCTVHSCMHVLPEGYYCLLTGLGTVLVIFSECIDRFPCIMCVSDPIHPDFFVSRTYVLWNKNRILLAAIVCTSFVSSKSTHDIQASGRCISQIVIIATFGIVFVNDVPAACTFSNLPSEFHAIETSCSISQMQLAQSRESQGATRVHPVTSFSYHFFSFPCSKWVGSQEHIYAQARADLCSPQDSWSLRSYMPYRAGGQTKAACTFSWWTITYPIMHAVFVS